MRVGTKGHLKSYEILTGRGSSDQYPPKCHGSLEDRAESLGWRVSAKIEHKCVRSRSMALRRAAHPVSEHTLLILISYSSRHTTSFLPSSPPLMWRDSSRSSSVVRQHSLFTLRNLTIKQLPSKSHSKPLKVSLQLLKKPSPLIKVQVTHNQYPPALSHRLLSAPKTLNTNIPQTKISQCLFSQCMM